MAWKITFTTLDDLPEMLLIYYARAELCNGSYANGFDDYIQNRLFDKVVPFHESMKKLKLKIFASEGVISRQLPWSFIITCYVFNLLISARILVTW